jgi:flagellar biosynthesis protein FliR
VGLAIFSVNIAFGVVARAMPQVNVLVLSFAVTALVGLIVMLVTISDSQGAVSEVLSRIGDWMIAVSKAVSSG